MTSAILCCCAPPAAILIWRNSTAPRSANPALRPLLRRAGLPELRDPARLGALREAITRARDDANPDWAAIGQPVATLVDTIGLRHPSPKPAVPPAARAGLSSPRSSA